MYTIIRYNFTALLLIYFHCAWAARNFDLNITSFSCVHYPETSSPAPLMANCLATMRASPHHKRRMLATLAFTLLRPAHKPLVRVVLQAARANQNTSLMTLMDANFAICEFFDAPVKNSLMGILYKAVETFVNEMPKCPLKSNFTYVVKDFYFSAVELPPYTPEGSYNCAVDLFEYGNRIFTISGAIDVIYRRTVWHKI